MQSPDLQRMAHIRDYCNMRYYGSMSREIIWKTANEDIPMLLEFCNEILHDE